MKNMTSAFLAMIAFGLVGVVPVVEAQEEGSLTPSHVYQNTKRILAEINLIRKHSDITDTPRDPGRQIKKLPIHVFSKAVELMGKIGRRQRSIGMAPMSAALLPFEHIDPGMVNAQADRILADLKKLKRAANISEKIAQQTFEPGKTPSDVYGLMWQASYAFDGIVGQISPGEVFHNARLMMLELEIITSSVGVEGSQAVQERSTDKTPENVLTENFVSMYKIARIQRFLAMEPFYVPPLPGGSITPSNVYDTTVTILAELHRCKIKLGLTERAVNTDSAVEKTPSDVFDQVKLFQTSLDKLLSSLDKG